MKILITGFEPFDTFNVNSSQVLVQRLSELGIESIEIHSAILPVDLVESFERIKQEITPDLDRIILFGMAAGVSAIVVERVALNLADFRIPDNAGNQPQDAPIVADGPVAYFATSDTKRIHTALKNAGYQTRLSLSAGSYICNALFYNVLHYLHESRLAIPTAFMHLPAVIHPEAQFDDTLPRIGVSSLIEAGRIAILNC